MMFSYPSTSPPSVHEMLHTVPEPIPRESVPYVVNTAEVPSLLPMFAPSPIDVEATTSAHDQNAGLLDPLWFNERSADLSHIEDQQWSLIGTSIPGRESLGATTPSWSTILEADTTNIDLDGLVMSEDPTTSMQQVALHDKQPEAADARPAQSSARLLRWFYRISPEHYADTDLVEHYFGQVCRLYTIFDSTRNPFRTLVYSNWDSSETISLAIQSMACGHLANRNPTMARLGFQKQQQARNSISEDLQLYRAGKIGPNKILLAVILLGTTASWHNENDIGLEYITVARELVQAKLKHSGQDLDRKTVSLDQFFLQAMIYYEMLLALVDDSANSDEPEEDALTTSLQSFTMNDSVSSTAQASNIEPHPWTGIAPHIQMLFAEVGRILRRRVNRPRDSDTEKERLWASTVEKSLKAAVIPTGESIDDAYDQNTPRSHFIQLAEAYRCAGLLQIYHVFPNVLFERMAGEMESGAALPSTDDMRRYRTALAFRTLDLVESMPISSGASCLHPILILTAGSELRYYGSPLQDDLSAQAANQRIDLARTFAKDRMSALAARLPQKPYLRMLNLLKEIWLQMDLLGTDVHWMQVMYENGWETIMG